ncbi:MAG: hypothetical protein Aurels2KO_24280 [Aureliella sp.]
MSDIAIEQGDDVVLDGERYLKIEGVDKMPEFFMSLVGASDHWMFVTSYGAVTAGRRNPDQAIFPYAPDEQLSIGRLHNGPRTLVRTSHNGVSDLWRPLHNYEHAGAVLRNLYKTPLGNKLVFEEFSEPHGLSFRYRWAFSERFGFVRTCSLENVTDSAITLELVDGLAGLLPAGLDSEFSMRFGNLANAYKSAELVDDSPIGLIYLSSLPTDRAEPSEGLTATTVWQTGLSPTATLLSEDQLLPYRAGTCSLTTEHRSRGRRCAYMTASELQLEPGESKTWHVVAEVNQDHSEIVRLEQWLSRCLEPAAEIEDDIQRSERALLRIVASTDGLQTGQNSQRCDRHLGNAIFNAMRGGVPLDGYRIDVEDFRNHVDKASREVANTNATFLSQLTALSTTELIEKIDAQGDPSLMRLGLEYLPLAFSRRHGDPTRPWNRFSIDLRTSNGQTSLNYQGNWRDIFQNWEALAFSFPKFLPNMISRFVNATTADGYNPYRMTKDGFEWEEPEPDNPWSNIGYWGDHQIVYLLKLLESCHRALPQQLGHLLSQRIFTHANVPYRIKPFEQIVDNPHETIDFDAHVAQQIEERLETLGQDAKLLSDQNGKVVHVTLLEKLLTLTLAKLSNFVPDGGIWMNTQRPEWNDANNALVGNGLSMVTACYLHRWCVFLRDLLVDAQASGSSVDTRVSTAIGDLMREIASSLSGAKPGECTSAKSRRDMCQQLGQAASRYRERLYTDGLQGDAVELDLAACIDLFDHASQHLRDTIESNRRSDGLYHSYNLLNWTNDGVFVDHLSEMLEGQVAVLCSGTLDSEEAVQVLDALRSSSLYRADQDSYMLYPDKQLSRFQDKNQISEEAANAIPLIKRMLATGDTRIIHQDSRGWCHFNSAFRNSAVVRRAMSEAVGDRASDSEVAAVVKLYESTFRHRNFTGRSGTFFAYEGLGSIYWHMVSKLRLAVAEEFLEAVDRRADADTIQALRDHYDSIRSGIGAEKTPEQYGAFPSDPYSHTPEQAGVKQPGMTGQVKEDFLARFVELGVGFDQQKLSFRVELFDRAELVEQSQEFTYFDLSGEVQTIGLRAGSFAMLVCQVPVVYHASAENRIEVTLHDGSSLMFSTLHLDEHTTQLLMSHSCRVERIDCFFSELS